MSYFYKRLENGTFQWSRTLAEVRLILGQEFRWLMEGLSMNQPKQ
ncbi:MAG: IS66 family insertion sequence element accessory protein TnpB [Clostridiales bacterium]|nr:IS66 family insertion sequence element accessory protein TnpB [Clostridiales bacterium]